MTKNTDLNEENLTLSDISLQLDKDKITDKEAKDHLETIVLTDCWHSYETPGKMIFDGDPKNSVITIDRLCGEGELGRGTWRRIHELLVKKKSSSKASG